MRDDIMGILYWWRKQLKEDELVKTKCWLCGFEYDNRLLKCPRCGKENDEIELERMNRELDNGNYIDDK